MKKEIIYKVFFDNNKLVSQLEWANFSLISKNKTILLFKNQLIRFKDYSNNISLGIILEDSSKKDNNVIICPIAIESKNIDVVGINLGKINYVNNNENYIALIHKIQRISKNLIVIDELINECRFYIEDLYTKKIVSYYKEFLSQLMGKNAKFEKVCIC